MFPSCLPCLCLLLGPLYPALQVCQLVSWLRGNVPAEDSSASVVSVVHGDFRLDNMVYDSQLQVCVFVCVCGGDMFGGGVCFWGGGGEREGGSFAVG